MAVRKPQAFVRQPIDLRRLHVPRAIRGYVAVTEIIRVDQDDVRTGLLGNGIEDAGCDDESRQEEKAEHVRILHRSGRELPSQVGELLRRAEQQATRERGMAFEQVEPGGARDHQTGRRGVEFYGLRATATM
jgi:hypothetical protein